MRYICCCVLVLLASGCATAPQPGDQPVLGIVADKAFAAECETQMRSGLRVQRLLKDHVIRVSPLGVMIDPLTHEPLDEQAAAEYVKEIFCEAELLARYHGDENNPRMLVYVHGGLNNYGHTNEKVNTGIAWDIMMDRDDWHYPVFISWHSGAVSAWLEHTFRLREGRRTNLAVGMGSSPFVFLSDLMTWASRYPITAYYQAATEKDRILSGTGASGWVLTGSWRAANSSICGEERCGFDQPPCGGWRSKTLQVNLSDYHTSWWNRVGRGTTQVVGFPFRYTVGSVWHSTFSASAWDVMKHRVHNALYPPSDFDGRWKAINGAVAGARFFELLILRGEEKPYQVTLVGHSMGTMILNRVLSEYQPEWRQSGMLRNIVYMAAAASIEDSMYALRPILVPEEAAEGSKGRDDEGARHSVNFYNLTLNRVAEASEMHALSALPMGSLLISIDQHYESPDHWMRRTFGSEINVLSSLPVLDAAFEKAPGEVVFKAFDRNPGRLPAVHGDFSLMEFWKKGTWRQRAPVFSETTVDLDDCEGLMPEPTGSTAH